MTTINTPFNKSNISALVDVSQRQGEKYRWQLIEADEAAVRTLSDATSLSVPIARTLYTRGYDTPEKVFGFITMGEEWIADPALLKGATQAVDRLQKALENNEKILIFGDYDVDGITSTAIMLSCLLPLDANINYFLPNRKRDGYGLSSRIAKKAAENGYHLIVTVDNGITAHQPVKDAKEAGLDVIITDHHQVHGELPMADVIVNPHQPDCPYPYKDFAGVGVIFKIMALLYKRLGKDLPQKAYELLMLGTIADVVPLRDENRYWVQRGLAHINKKRSIAVQVLAANGKVANKPAINSRDIGFSIAPQLNALGRLDDPRDGVSFLISTDFGHVMQVGSGLKAINEERKRIDRSIFDEIDATIANKTIDLEKENLIVAAHTDWPAGVIGLVAGRLVQKYGRPAILLHLTKDGTAKGSCRSIEAFNIFDALVECEDFLIGFGGHACAAGLSLKQENIPKLKEVIEARIARELAPEDLVQKLDVAAPAELRDIGKTFVQQLRSLEPFGNANPEPVFWFEGVNVVGEPKLLKHKHVKCTLFADGVIKPIMFFNRPELYKQLFDQGDKSFAVAATVVENEWQGKSTTELLGVDISF